MGRGTLLAVCERLPFACEGCYNVIAQNFNYGIPYTKELEAQIVEDVGVSYCQGLTLLEASRFKYGVSAFL